MVAWGIVVIVALVMAYMVLRLHLVRRRKPPTLRDVQAVLKEQSGAFDRLLTTANGLNEQLAQLMTEAGIPALKPPGRSGPTPPPQRPADHTDPDSEKDDPPPTVVSSGLSSVAQEEPPSERRSAAAAVRRQRGRQWTQINVASETAADVVPEPASSSVFRKVSGGILAGFHGSGVNAVSREWSRREEGLSNPERDSLGGSIEKSARPGIVDPRAVWEQETYYGEIA
jgi:hypothetical protein